MRLHHVAIAAQDVQRVADFYIRAFELTELRRQNDETGALRSIWVDAAGTILMIERGEAEAHSSALLAFAIEPEERAAWELRIEASGASIESRSEFSSYARDPEGNRVAVSHYPRQA